MLSPKLSLVSFASFLSHFWSIFLSHLFRGCLSSSRFGSVGATFFPFGVFLLHLFHERHVWVACVSSLEFTRRPLTENDLIHCVTELLLKRRF